MFNLGQSSAPGVASAFCIEKTKMSLKGLSVCLSVCLNTRFVFISLGQRFSLADRVGVKIKNH